MKKSSNKKKKKEILYLLEKKIRVIFGLGKEKYKDHFLKTIFLILFAFFFQDSQKKKMKGEGK